MDYMHLLVGRPTQNSKKFEVCYVLGDTAYVRPNRLKEDAKVSFIDWPDTVLGRLQAVYDCVPLKQDRDNVLVDYRKLVACLKDAFITLTDGSYESSELFDETCPDSDLRRVFLASLEVFGLSNMLTLKTDDVWNLLEDLDASVHKISDKAVFNRLQERYLDKGFSVFTSPESLIGHDYGMIQEGSEIYKQLLFDLIHPFDATFLVNTSLTVLGKIEHGDFESEAIDGQLLNVIGDWLYHFKIVGAYSSSLNETSKDDRVRDYKAAFKKFLAFGTLSGASLHLFTDVKLSSFSLEDLKKELLNPLARDKDKAMVDSIADSLSSEIDVMPFERKMSSIDTSLVDLATATSELVSDVVKLSESVDSEVVELSSISTFEEHHLNNYSEALPETMLEPIGIFEDVVADVKPTLSTWSADNREFRELPSREQLEEYAEEKSVPLFDLESKEDTVKPLDVPKEDTFYVESSIPMEVSKKDTFYVEPLPQKEYDGSILDTTVPKKDMLYMEPIRKKGTVDSPFFYPWCDPSITESDVVVTDKKPGFYTTGLEMALDNLPPKEVLKNVYVDYGPLCAAVQLCLLQDVFDVRVMIDELLTLFNDIGRGDYALCNDLRREKIKFLRSGLIRCLLEVKGNVVSSLWDNQTDNQFGFDVKTVQHVLTNLIKIYGRNEGTIERWFSVSDETKGLIKQALDYVSNDTMFVKMPVSLNHTEFSDWLSDKECDALSRLLFFDAKKTDWYRSKAIEKDLMEQYKNCSLLSLDFLKDDTVTNPSRYRKNTIEAWDFTIQSLLPHPLATVAEYVIRYPYKGGREDLEKAIAWAQKAEKSCSYLKATVGYGDSIVDELPKVTKEMFPDCSEGQCDVLRAVQKATLALRGSLGYGEPEDALKDVTVCVKKLLDEV